MATRGEIQWPPVGRINGRLRGELHGRRQRIAWPPSFRDSSNGPARARGLEVAADDSYRRPR
jgi:hypothetical protein